MGKFVESLASPYERSWWNGKVSRPHTTVPRLSVKAILDRTFSGSGVLKAVTSDREIAWIKGIGNGHGNQALVTERVVAGVSEHLDLPAVPTYVVDVPNVFSGYTLDKDRQTRLSPGPAHASTHIEDAVERDKLDLRNRDNNPIRHAGVAAMWDLFLGQDDQWLYDIQNDYSTWSYDHGLWLARSTNDWDEQMLRNLCDQEWQVRVDPRGFDPYALRDLAARLRSIEPTALISVAESVPVEWGTPDTDLEALCWFIYRRSRRVAGRLEVMSDELPDAP